MITYIWIVTREEEESKEYMMKASEVKSEAENFKRYCEKMNDGAIYKVKKFKNTQIKE